MIAQEITLLVGCFILGGFFLAEAQWRLLWQHPVPQEKALCSAQVILLSNTSLNSSPRCLPRDLFAQRSRDERRQLVPNRDPAMKHGLQWRPQQGGHCLVFFSSSVVCTGQRKPKETLRQWHSTEPRRCTAAAAAAAEPRILHSASLLPPVNAANSRKGWIKRHRCFNYDLITEWAEESILRNVQLEKILRTI